MSDEAYKDELRQWMCDGSFHAATGMEKEWLEKGQGLLVKIAQVPGAPAGAPLAEAVESAMRTTLQRTKLSTLFEALVETAQRMKKGLHSPTDYLLLIEAAKRLGVIREIRELVEKTW